MIASMFNLDQRLAELRPSEAELRLARQRRDAAISSGHSGGPRADSSARSARVRLGGASIRVPVG